MIQPLIRNMRGDDLDFAARCAAAEGWHHETRQEFEGFLAYDPRGCFVAEDGGQRAGICITVRYGKKGFVGEMIVLPEFRAKGLGPRLFSHALMHLIHRGCTSISLDAVPRAASFYESLGFRKISLSLRFSKSIALEAHPQVGPMAAADFDRVCDLDKRAFGADRSFFLRRRLMLYPELTGTQKAEGRIVGYIFGRQMGSRLWAGPWWVAGDAVNPDSLLAKFGRRPGASEIGLGALETNTRAVSLFRESGFEEKSPASIRMVMGNAQEAPGLSLDLWAIGSPAKG